MIMLNLPPQLEKAVISMAQLQNMQTEEYIIDCLQKNIPVDEVPDHVLNDFQSFDQ